MKNTKSNNENVENVGTVDKNTETTDSTYSTDEVQQIANTLKKIFNHEMRKFVPKKTMLEIFQSEIKFYYPEIDSSELILPFEKAFDRTIKLLNNNDRRWNMHFFHTYKKRYPEIPREFYKNGKICQRTSKIPTSRLSNKIITYKTESFVPVSEIGKKLHQYLQPNAFEIRVNKLGKFTTAETAESDRFLNNEETAVLESNLHVPIVFNRPMYRTFSGWSRYTPEEFKVELIVSTLISDSNNRKLLEEFVIDLYALNIWEDKTSFFNYLGYIIQPMIGHLALGQMPGYLFQGPTGIGKNYLAYTLIALLYSREDQSAVSIKTLVGKSTEFDLYLGSNSENVYIIFDEFINAKGESLKRIDSLLTIEVTKVRGLYTGYNPLENNFVFAFTAINKMLPPETEGRIVRIRLKQQGYENRIKAFQKKWSLKTPELLSTIHAQLNSIDINDDELLAIPGRRIGFSYLTYFIEKLFGFKTSYNIEVPSINLLDLICKLRENLLMVRDRYSIEQVRTFIVAQTNNNYNRELLITDLLKALGGYESICDNPYYRENGYEAESGYCYDIRFKNEKCGGEQKRWFLYIKLKKSKLSNESDNLSTKMDNPPNNESNVSSCNTSKSNDDEYFFNIASEAFAQLNNLPRRSKSEEL